MLFNTVVCVWEFITKGHIYFWSQNVTVAFTWALSNPPQDTVQIGMKSSPAAHHFVFQNIF